MNDDDGDDGDDGDEIVAKGFIRCQKRPRSGGGGGEH